MTTMEYTNGMGDTHVLSVFDDGSVIVDNFDAFTSLDVAKRFCDCETIYDDEAGETQAHIALYGNPKQGWKQPAYDWEEMGENDREFYQKKTEKPIIGAWYVKRHPDSYGEAISIIETSEGVTVTLCGTGHEEWLPDIEYAGEYIARVERGWS